MTDTDGIAMPKGRTWSVSTTSGETLSGYLPVWAQEDPSKTGVAPDRLAAVLSDITHEACMGGELLRVCWRADGPGVESPALTAYMQCRPFPESGVAESVPHVNVQLFDDLWVTGLDPDGVTEVAVKFRDFADLLIHKVTPALYGARNDWTAHFPVEHQQL